jgi:hypothetical protein
LPRNVVELLQVEKDAKLGRNDGIDSRIGSELDFVDRPRLRRIQKGYGKRLGVVRCKPERDGAMFLSQLRGNKTHRLPVNGLEVLLQRCRHAFLAGERACERLQLDGAELDEVRSDSPAV